MTPKERAARNKAAGEELVGKNPAFSEAPAGVSATHEYFKHRGKPSQDGPFRPSRVEKE
jgi:hypothetical protein